MAGLIYQDNASWSHINASAFEVGMAFHVSASLTLTGLSWFRYVTGAQVAPEIVRLWRAGDTTELGRLTSIPDDGTVAWQAGDLTTPIALVTGQVYIVSAYFPGNAGQPSRSTGATPDSPVVLEGSYRRYLSGSAGFPANADAGSFIGVDILGTPAGGTGGGTGGTGADITAIDADVASWLSANGTTNTHHSDLPWRTDANVTTVKGEAEGVNGFAAIKAVADAIASAVAGLPGTIANAVTTITGQITSSTADIFSHAVTGLTAISGDVRDVENHALDVLAGMVTFPGASPHYAWTAGDPIGFDQCVAVAVPAEAYHLEILSHPRHPLNQVCGVNIIYRSGWWCELSGEIGAERHYIDFEKTLLRAGSHRLSGCLVSLEPGFSGVLTPYTLEPV